MSKEATHLSSFLQEIDQTASLRSILRRDETESNSLLVLTTGTTDAMNVRLRIVWVVKVDHSLHIFDIWNSNRPYKFRWALPRITKSTSSNISRQQNWNLPRTKLWHNPISFVLRFVSMNRQCWKGANVKGSDQFTWPSSHTHRTSHLISLSLGLHEDKDLCISFGQQIAQKLKQAILLVHLLHDFNNLLNIVICGEFQRSDIQENRLSLEVLRKSSNLFGPS